LETIDVPFDPIKGGWKQTVCGTAPMQVLHKEGKADSLIVPLDAIDTNHDAEGSLPGFVKISLNNNHSMKRIHLPDGVGNAIGMGLSSDERFLYVSTQFTQLLKYEVSTLKLVANMSLPVPLDPPAGAPRATGCSGYWASMRGLTVSGDEELIGTMTCNTPQGIMLPQDVGVGSLLRIDTEKMKVVQATQLPGQVQVGDRLSIQEGKAYVPLTVKCDDEPTMLCPGLYTVGITTTNGTVEHLLSLWNSTSDVTFYGNPYLGLAPVFSSSSSTASSTGKVSSIEGILATGTACSATPIPPASLKETEASFPGFCEGGLSPRLAHYSYQDPGEVEIIKVPGDGSGFTGFYKFLSGSTSSLLNPDGMVIYGVKGAMGPANNLDQLTAMRWSKGKLTFLKSAGIPYVDPNVPTPSPMTPLCFHKVDTVDHKCFEACSTGDTKFHTKGISNKGKCPELYNIQEKQQMVEQCPDGVTNLKYCAKTALKITVTTYVPA